MTLCFSPALILSHNNNERFLYETDTGRLKAYVVRTTMSKTDKLLTFIQCNGFRFLSVILVAGELINTRVGTVEVPNTLLQSWPRL